MDSSELRDLNFTRGPHFKNHKHSAMLVVKSYIKNAIAPTYIIVTNESQITTVATSTTRM